MLHKRIANGIPLTVQIPYICFRCRLASASAAPRVRRQYHASLPRSLSNSFGLRASQATLFQEPEKEASLDILGPDSQHLSANAERTGSEQVKYEAENVVETKPSARKEQPKRKRKKKSVTNGVQVEVRTTLKRLTPRQKRAKARLQKRDAKTAKASRVHTNLSMNNDEREAVRQRYLESINPRLNGSRIHHLEDDEAALLDGDGIELSELGSNQTLIEALKPKSEPQPARSITTGDIALTALDVERKPVPRLAYGLSRALFNPGILELRDLRSRVFNFDPYLEKLMPVAEFDFSTLKQFTTASKDPALRDIAQKYQKKYVCSSSSMTGLLKHFHYLISGWREPHLNMLSAQFPAEKEASFTRIQRGPEAVFLRWNGSTYGVDADKEYDSANILSMMGQYMEKLLTVDKAVFEKHRVGKSHSLSEEERSTVDSYHYSTVGDFVMRSQLDAYDPRLPGTGMFDLKTRAVLPIRMDLSNFEWGTEYEIQQHRGEYHSFEREYHDMIRATLLKYSLQVRMGRMDGIFVAYHNITRMFGFQYISLAEIDEALHGQSDPYLGDQEFLFSLHILNDLLKQATEKYPEQSLRLHIETRPSVVNPFMYFFAEPVTEDEMNAVQNKNTASILAWQKKILGLESPDEVSETLETNASSPISSKKKAKTADPDMDPKRPLMGVIITIKSLVNDKSMKRPRNLTPADKWEVQYDIDDIGSPRKAWVTYLACQARRKELLLKATDLRQDDDFFLKQIRNVTEASREWRAKRDANDSGKPIRMWNDEGAEQTETEPSIAPEVQPSTSGLASRIFNKLKGWNSTGASTTNITNASEDRKGPSQAADSGSEDIKDLAEVAKGSLENVGHSSGFNLTESASRPEEVRPTMATTDIKATTDTITDTKPTTSSSLKSAQTNQLISYEFSTKKNLGGISSTKSSDNYVTKLPVATQSVDMAHQIVALRKDNVDGIFRKLRYSKDFKYPEEHVEILQNRTDLVVNLVRNTIGVSKDTIANTDSATKLAQTAEFSASHEPSVSQLHGFRRLNIVGSNLEQHLTESQSRKTPAEVASVTHKEYTEILSNTPLGGYETSSDGQLSISHLTKMIEIRELELARLREIRRKASTSTKLPGGPLAASSRTDGETENRIEPLTGKPKSEIIPKEESQRNRKPPEKSGKPGGNDVSEDAKVEYRAVRTERRKAAEERKREAMRERDSARRRARAAKPGLDPPNSDLDIFMDMIDTERRAIVSRTGDVRRDFQSVKRDRTKIDIFAAVTTAGSGAESVAEVR